MKKRPTGLRTKYLQSPPEAQSKMLGFQADAALGARVRFVALKVEAHGRHVHAEQTFLAAGAELGFTKEHIEAEAEVVLVEGKVGGDVSVRGVDIKGSFVVGFLPVLS